MLAANWTPTGKLSAVQCNGSEIAGWPPLEPPALPRLLTLGLSSQLNRKTATFAVGVIGQAGLIR